MAKKAVKAANPGKKARKAMRKVKKHGPLAAAIVAGVAGASGLGAVLVSKRVRGQVRGAALSVLESLRTRKTAVPAEPAEVEGEHDEIEYAEPTRAKSGAPNGIAGVGPV